MMTVSEASTTLQILHATRELLADSAAVRWCVSGALSKVGRDLTTATDATSYRGSETARAYLARVLRATTTTGRLLPQFNDQALHADVLALLDTAIGRLEREGRAS